MIFYPGRTQILTPTPGIDISRSRGNSALYNSLVAYWKLDEVSGDRADSVGSNTLTDTNTVTSATGLIYPLAGSFASASTEYLTINDNAALSTGDVDFWVAAWIWVATSTNTTSRCVIAKNTTSTNREFRMALNVGQPLWLVMNNGVSNAQVVRSTTIGVAGWHFMLGWHDSVNNIIGMRFNNEADLTTAYSGGSADSTAKLRIGQLEETASLYWEGRIGPVMMGKGYAPTAGDLAFLYNDGNGRTLDAMRAY